MPLLLLLLHMRTAMLLLLLLRKRTAMLLLLLPKRSAMPLVQLRRKHCHDAQPFCLTSA
jgi:hypothetical protein